jgi:hypothetical protein
MSAVKLSNYHQDSIELARERAIDIQALNPHQMGDALCEMWLVRMITATEGLLEVIDLLVNAGVLDAREARR